MGNPSSHLASGEQVVLQLRTHVKQLFGPILLALILLAAMIAAFVWVPNGNARPWILLVIAVVLLAIAVTAVVLPILRWLTTTYTVTTRRLMTRRGIVSRSGRDVPLFRINDVSYEKGLTDRLFGCGTLLVSDASDQPPLVLPDVPHVEDVQVRINELLFAHDGADEGRIPPTQPWG